MKYKTILIGLSFLLVVISHFTYAIPGCIQIPAVKQNVTLKDKVALVKRKLKMRKIASLNDNEDAITNSSGTCTACSKATFKYLEAKVPYSDTKATLLDDPEAPQNFVDTVASIQDFLKEKGLDYKQISSRKGMNRQQALAYLDKDKFQPGRTALVSVVLDINGEEAPHLFLVLKGTGSENPSFKAIEMRGRARFDAAKEVDLRSTLNSTDGSWYKYTLNEKTPNENKYELKIKDFKIGVMFFEKPF
ncbi:hypothetical protein CJF42_24715 [Pseudoalteromonas sp. NBT06-2]|uniref:hypothetical protein n=1 Tax=Pseudoalteromonas sp. NBT06-2 TaxID=2025950 RepID=UPI000BA5BD53|nr:hypothetical protein [Pseudoalteromonas sp. NBT06-2]PAJ71814.1 hypothetical protein CJF42_24715 [Pseudoalteromonas sp. NBT06-2]